MIYIFFSKQNFKEEGAGVAGKPPRWAAATPRPGGGWKVPVLDSADRANIFQKYQKKPLQQYSTNLLCYITEKQKYPDKLSAPEATTVTQIYIR
jgi:hypothetical protein